MPLAPPALGSSPKLKATPVVPAAATVPDITSSPFTYKLTPDAVLVMSISTHVPNGHVPVAA